MTKFKATLVIDLEIEAENYTQARGFALAIAKGNDWEQVKMTDFELALTQVITREEVEREEKGHDG